ncbi:MAG: hypothetical protein ABR517_07580 [Thermoanaerobaculia bacterium]
MNEKDDKQRHHSDDEASEPRAKRTGREGTEPGSLPGEFINEQPNRTGEPPAPGKSDE